MVKKIEIDLLNKPFQKIDPFQPSTAFHIEISHLFCSAKQNEWFLYETQHWAKLSK